MFHGNFCGPGNRGLDKAPIDELDAACRSHDLCYGSAPITTCSCNAGLARDASKVALVHLVARLIAGGFALLDTQYVTEHLRSFGAVEIPRRRYLALLDQAIKGNADFAALPVDRPITGAKALEIIAGR